MRRQFLEASGVRADKRRVIERLGDDDAHDGQREGSVGPRPDQKNFSRMRCARNWNGCTNHAQSRKFDDKKVPARPNLICRVLDEDLQSKARKSNFEHYPAQQAQLGQAPPSCQARSLSTQ